MTHVLSGNIGSCGMNTLDLGKLFRWLQRLRNGSKSEWAKSPERRFLESLWKYFVGHAHRIAGERPFHEI